jgi:hypothetical protein
MDADVKAAGSAGAAQGSASPATATTEWAAATCDA